MTRILLALLVACPLLAAAQFSFTNASPALLPADVRSPLAIGVADMNGDNLHDVVRVDQNFQLRIDYQQPAGVPYSTQLLGYVGNEWSLCIGDLDNNGLNDVSSGGFYNTVKLFYNVPAGGNSHSFIPATLTNPSIFLQGSNFADIDNDGYLDYFACHDHGLAPAFRNQGNGSLVHDPTLIDPVSTIPSDNSGNYGSTWTDYDNDGDTDLYISKCRGGVYNPLDGRRVNLLFRNDGGTFTEVAEAANLRPLGQSWATDFADFDNDGDLDALIVNHDIPSLYYRNNGDGTFTERTEEVGLADWIGNLNQAVEVMSADFDNDGHLDLLVTSLYSGYVLIRNLGNGTFDPAGQQQPFETGGENLCSAALGDLNNDGFVDVMGVFANGYVARGSQSDRLYLNDGNANHWLGVHLRGHASNRNGIGARLELHGSWGKQIREIRSGESYGISHAHHGNFGIGAAQSIDSLVVRWPSGLVSTVLNPTVDQYLPVEEPQVVAPVIQQVATSICAGSSLAFNGEQLAQTGTYYDTLAGQNGATTIIELSLTVNPVSESTETISLCSGSAYQFPDGSQLISLLEPISHLSTLTGAAGCDSLVTTVLLPLPVNEVNRFISVCPGSSYQFSDGTTAENISTPVTHTSVLTAGSGCDSLVTTTVTPLAVPETTEQFEVCAGSPFIFPDGTLTAGVTTPLTHLSILTAASGCDSLVTTTLLPIAIDEIAETYTVCAGSTYTFPDGTVAQNVTTPLAHLSILVAVTGCDSLVTTTLLPLQIPETTETYTICSGDTYSFPDGSAIENITAPLTHLSTLTAAAGCDSVVTTQIELFVEISTTEMVAVCSGESYTLPDGSILEQITTDQYYLSTLTALSGCDSLVTTFVEVIAPVADFSQSGNLLTAYQVTGPATYQWLSCTNSGTAPISEATQSTFLAQHNGDYAVAVTQDGCTVVSDCRNVTTVAIAEQIDPAIIRFDPTTDDGWFTVEGPWVVSARLRVFAADGRLVVRRQIRGSERFFVGGPAGVYFYHLLDKQGGVKTGKLLVK